MGIATASSPPASSVLDVGTCLDCGYPLRGLNEMRCPECGRPFDPADPESFEGPMRAVRRMRLALHWAPIAAWVATMGGVPVGVYLLAREVSYDYFGLLWRAPSLLLVGTLLLAGLARGRARRALLGRAADPHPISERVFRSLTWIACVALLFTPGGLRQWSCPHGWGIGLGPVGIAHSTVGGPCRNTIAYDYKWAVTGPWYVWAEVR